MHSVRRKSYTLSIPKEKGRVYKGTARHGQLQHTDAHIRRIDHILKSTNNGFVVSEAMSPPPISSPTTANLKPRLHSGRCSRCGYGRVKPGPSFWTWVQPA
ncbi:hypothetical protein Pyn_09575 [Prunus yedoensis var. nudiflora]|uniref:Uncharacterized protein n=1 Tax=Prunus yedoensis var. nudiflora TaxID=2094558 RepID=A0A314XWG6_PRUYE|nr:hypothetical protein Pyn_09575 [Prunus yedoensis var. nudiflora]